MSETGAEKSGTPPEKKPKSEAGVPLFGCLFDPVSKTLKGPDGALIPLRAQSAEVLAILVEAGGETVSRDDLIARVWPDTFVTEDSLGKCIADIRKALGDTDRSRVQTLPKIGYRLNLTAPVPATDAKGRLGDPPRLAALVLAYALAAWGLWSLFAPDWTPEKPRIAVLAFDDFSTGEDQGFLSDAIAEGLITELARFPTLGVIARTSSFSYRDTDATIDTIRDELRVHYILEGSQQKNGDQLKVTAQLIDTRTGDHVWAETFDRELADLFTIQEEIVRGTAGVVGNIVELRPLPESDIAQVTALRYFLQTLGSPDSRDMSENRLEIGRKAIEVDPDSEWGYLITAWTHRHMASFFSTPEEKAEHMALAEANVETALKIAPDNFYGYWVRAQLRVESGDHAGATEAYKQAIALNPSAVHMLAASSSPLLYTGQYQEGLDVIDRALDLDPKHKGWFHWQRAWALWELDRCQEAVEAFDRMARIFVAARRMQAAAYACLDDQAAATEALAVFLEDNPEATLAAEEEKLAAIWPNPTSLDRWLRDMAFAGMPE